jgi:hypothetical protein
MLLETAVLLREETRFTRTHRIPLDLAGGSVAACELTAAYVTRQGGHRGDL